MPNISARPVEIAESGVETGAPGLKIGPMIASLSGCTSTALANSALGLKPNATSTRSAISVAPPSSRQALMICTQVVAIMPPKVT